MYAYDNKFYDWNPNFDPVAHYWPDTANVLNKNMTNPEHVRQIVASSDPRLSTEVIGMNGHMPMATIPTFENQYQRYDYIGAHRPKPYDGPLYPSTMKCTPEYKAASARMYESDKGYAFGQRWNGPGSASYYDREDLVNPADQEGVGINSSSGRSPSASASLMNFINDADHSSLFVLILIIFLAILGASTLINGILGAMNYRKTGSSEFDGSLFDMFSGGDDWRND